MFLHHNLLIQQREGVLDLFLTSLPRRGSQKALVKVFYVLVEKVKHLRVLTYMKAKLIREENK